jgi:hypothetical protein
MQARRVAVLGAFMAGSVTFGMAQSPEQAFDVVSIKRNVSDDKNIHINAPVARRST